ncbi:MAG: OmpA family protein [Roseibacillus sp.]|jgi:outer membrane protein OmpA-like peptidoglycan-associated protein|nr:OmpA family protein [Roseibacillus sp.]
MSFDPYDSYESRSAFGVVVLVAAVVVSGVAFFFVARFLSSEGNEAKDSGGAEEPAEVVRALDKAPEQFGPVEVTVAPESADRILNSLGIGVTTADPALLVEQIGRTLEAGKIQAAANLIGRKALSEDQVRQLQELADQGRLKLDEDRPISEIGELEVNRRGRWALNLSDDYGSRIYLDLLQKEGKWGVEKVVLPGGVPNGEGPGRAVMVDALGIAAAFLQAALRQNFETARAFVDPREVSDAKIAGLCIVFEEGQYQLREHKPLRAVLNRAEVAAFLANVETSDGSQAAQFGINLKRADENSPWRVVEINLDQLLVDYAQRVAGGDIYYTPLIRNPKGGDTLILYFGFDEETLTARTERQLEIVALLLQTNKEKKLTLSGHADAIGSVAYNKSLSGRRAETVRQFLVDSGVAPGQIETVALGKTQPRRPNTTVGGADNPDGRRVNRRAEIYLDF